MAHQAWRSLTALTTSRRRGGKEPKARGAAEEFLYSTIRDSKVFRKIGPGHFVLVEEDADASSKPQPLDREEAPHIAQPLAARMPTSHGAWQACDHPRARS